MFTNIIHQVKLHKNQIFVLNMVMILIFIIDIDLSSIKY